MLCSNLISDVKETTPVNVRVEADNSTVRSWRECQGAVVSTAVVFNAWASKVARTGVAKCKEQQLLTVNSTTVQLFWGICSCPLHHPKHLSGTRGELMQLSHCGPLNSFMTDSPAQSPNSATNNEWS